MADHAVADDHHRLLSLASHERYSGPWGCCGVDEASWVPRPLDGRGRTHKWLSGKGWSGCCLRSDQSNRGGWPNLYARPPISRATIIGRKLRLSCRVPIEMYYLVV